MAYLSAAAVHQEASCLRGVPTAVDRRQSKDSVRALGVPEITRSKVAFVEAESYQRNLSTCL